MLRLPYRKSIQRSLQSIATGVVSIVISILPAQSAEEIHFDYGPFGRVLPVSSLEAYAEDGAVDAELAPLLNLMSPEIQQDFRTFLRAPLPVASPDVESIYDPFVLSQWLYSPVGELTLAATGEFIQTQGRQNGRRAIRAALILAAADPDGLSLINILRYFPTGGVRLDLRTILAIAEAISTSIETTERLVDEVTQRSQSVADSEPAIDYAALPALGDSPQFGVVQRSLALQDSQRNRTYPVDLYLPDDLEAIQGPIPVFIISHGYGDTHANIKWISLARNLAANGFFVALPEHVGSNKAYQDALERGLTHETFQAMEFVNRPLDIRFLLDTLEQKNATEFQGRLQLDRVGLYGHSFGGYTVLTAAGATVDVNWLQQQCSLDAEITPRSINIALLLECRLLELVDSPEAMQQLTDGGLADDRVKLVIADAPVSNLFGETGVSQIQIPVVIGGGDL